MRFKGIIFDFDGTLANLTINFDKIKRKILLLKDIFVEDCGVDIQVPDLPLLECIEKLTEDFKKLDGDLAKEFNTRCRLILVDMEMRAARRGKLFDYTYEILDKCKKNGAKVAVVTRNCTPAVKMVFPDIEDIIDVFLPREDVLRVKPDPNHIETALKKLGTKKHESIMIGDHPIDIMCAKRAGVFSGAVATGNTSIDDLKKERPDFVAKDLLELFAKLEENINQGDTYVYSSALDG